MKEHPHTKVLKKILQSNPQHVFILPDGSAIAGLNGNEEVILIVAPEGVNFNSMTDEEVNQVIVDTLS